MNSNFILKITRHAQLDYVINWDASNGVSPAKNREHFIYIDRFCKQSAHCILKSWEPVINSKVDKKNPDLREFENEIKQHRLMFLKR